MSDLSLVLSRGQLRKDLKQNKGPKENPEECSKPTTKLASQPSKSYIHKNTMTQLQQFSCGIVQAPFVTSSGILSRTWSVYSRPEGVASSHVGNGLSWKIYKEPGWDLTIVAFQVNDGFNLKADLISSSDLKKKNFDRFEFLCTKKNPDFFVNASLISLFRENHQSLDQLKSEVGSSPRLIVTGHAFGGPIASLFTLTLLDSIAPGKKRPLCITYGSPLIGNKKFQEAISRSSTWNSCFLHVVSLKDPLPKALNSDTNAYMPFGTFLFCSDVSSTCFESPDSILEVLRGSIYDQNQGSQFIDYGKVVEDLYRKTIYKDSAAKAQDLTRSNSLRASITLHLWALGLTPDMQQQKQQNIDINALVTVMEKLEIKFILQKGKKFDPSKKLNLMKIDMAQLEWYKKDSKNRDIGYYDSYKNMSFSSDQDVVKFQRNLTLYWKDMVEEVEMRPQSEAGAFRTRWLFAGTNYRRMVEPLDIAEYYRQGGKDYVAEGRSRHYKVLEEWLKEDKENEKGGKEEGKKEGKGEGKKEGKGEGKKDTSDSKVTSKKNVELILTIDSCFWAYVEEALLSCKVLKDVKSSVTDKEEAARNLLKFEEYVYEMLKKYEVSPEIFLPNSSYMVWWNQYMAIKGTAGNQALATFMSKPSHHVQYTEGAYDFP
ncbi:hypothetical protein VNO77_35426 [Canavalia gladiata]|uniref:Uncharacterized protein n=1 Tax=Canavalia gladiata TaxID=3824 RepID=A0AAN9KG32_CANGL